MWLIVDSNGGPHVLPFNAGENQCYKTACQSPARYLATQFISSKLLYPYEVTIVASLLASESEWLKLVAKSLNGKEVQLKAKASDTIATLKKQLGSKDDSSSMDQLLVVNGKQLRDEQTLSDAGLTNGMKMKCVSCPRELILSLEIDC